MEGNVQKKRDVGRGYSIKQHRDVKAESGVKVGIGNWGKGIFIEERKSVYGEY